MTRLLFRALLALHLSLTGYLAYRIHQLPTFLPLREVPELVGLENVATPCLFAGQVSSPDETFAYEQTQQERLSRCYDRT